MNNLEELDFEIPKNIKWDILVLDDVKSPEKRSIISGPFGSNISSKYFTKSGVPVIRGNNLSNNLGVKFRDSGFVFISPEKAEELNSWAIKEDLLFTAAGTIGQVGILTGKELFEKYTISNKQLRVRLNKNIINPFYAYYWFASPTIVDIIIQRDTGSTIPLINLGVLKSLPILLPPLPEQESIAEALSSIDDKIDLLHRNNKTLEQLAETLFRQWFVEEAEDSWEEVKLSSIIDVRDGTHDSPKQSSIGYHLITSKHLKPNGIDFLNAYKISEEDYIEVNKRSKVDKNDILFSMIGTLGLIHLVDQEPNFAIKNMGLFKTSKKPEYVYYVYLLFRSSLGEKFIYENADGSTQEYITLGSLRNFEFKYPEYNKIVKFNQYVTEYFLKISANNKQLTQLETLRDTLLPKLMSGVVRVEN